jgi:putative ABC transport system permease protein
MSVARLILREIAHRRWSFLLGALGVAVTVALFVAFFTTLTAARRETKRVMRDLGFNLRIIPKDTDMDRFWTEGFSDRTLPEDAVRRLAEAKHAFLTYNHLVATLQGRIEIGGRPAILTGLAPTITSPDKRKRPMGFTVKPGTLQLGYQVAARLGLKRGDTLELAGRKFTIARCLVESGTEEDIRVYAALPDAQAILGLPGRINEIKAIDCLCLTQDQDPLHQLRAEIAKILPEARVIQLRAMADARARERQTVERYFGFLSPLLLLACAAWVGVLTALNVRERRAEIGVLRALGKGSGRVAGLFLGRAVLVGLLGAVIGGAAGTWLALEFGPRIFQLTAKAIRADYGLLGWALLVAPLFAAAAAFIPAARAVTLDPAVTLRED